MRVLLWALVIIGFIIGIVGAFVPFFIPEAAQALDPIICPGNDVVMIHQEPARDGGVSMSFRCVNDAGTQREPDFLIYFILFTAWGWVPLLPFLLLVLTGGVKMSSRRYTDHQVIVLPASGSGSTLTLTEKLQQLEDAYNSGLLTAAQYDDAKQKVLDNLSEG